MGRVTVRRDGSILLEILVLSDIKITNCDLMAESGEYPIPYADRMNVLEDFAVGGDSKEESHTGKENQMYVGHTCDYRRSVTTTTHARSRGTAPSASCAAGRSSDALPDLRA